MFVLNLVILSVVGVGTVATGGLGALGGGYPTTSSSSPTFRSELALGALEQYARSLKARPRT
jgi:hypothetical protein